MAPNNPLVVWGNEKTMNLNPLILTNIQSSPYFKVNLYELKTYHEVIDEIYFKVDHLEPWEKGSRKTAGQTGMCGGVRGVGAGGIVSSAFCLLYKLFTLKLTKKQVIGLITHQDSPYIRGLGFMYIRYTQPPQELWDWFDEYLDDDEDIDVKAGGGHTMTIGEMLRHWLTKLEWYSTLFPRIPVPVQKDIDEKLKNRIFMQTAQKALEETEVSDDRSTVIETDGHKKRSRTPDRRYERSRDRYARRSPSHKMLPCPPNHHTAQDDFALELAREQERQRRERDRNGRTEEHRSRSRSKGQHRVSLKYKNKSKIKEKIPAHYFWQSQSWSREKHSRRSQSQEYKHSKASCKKQSCSKDKHYSHKDKKEYSNSHEKETTRKMSEGKQNGAI